MNKSMNFEEMRRIASRVPVKALELYYAGSER
jgi:hypothetical protein